VNTTRRMGPVFAVILVIGLCILSVGGWLSDSLMSGEAIKELQGLKPESLLGYTVQKPDRYGGSRKLTVEQAGNFIDSLKSLKIQDLSHPSIPFEMSIQIKGPSSNQTLGVSIMSMAGRNLAVLEMQSQYFWGLYRRSFNFSSPELTRWTNDFFAKLE